MLKHVTIIIRQNQRRINFYNYHSKLKKMRPFKRHSSENTYEYPPLALNFILLPSYFIPQEIKTEPIILNDCINSYIKYYRFMCFAIEFILLLIITSLSCIYCEYFIKAAIPPIYFLILNFCMPVFIFDRIDIFLSLLIVTSIACLFNRKLLLLSYFLLALAICFKIVPIILLPIWIILSLKKENYRSIKSTVLTACKWFLIEIGLIVIITLPHLYFYKTECLSFLKYHLSRGLHIEIGGRKYCPALRPYYKYSNAYRQQFWLNKY